jgi:hypothetical protein
MEVKLLGVSKTKSDPLSGFFLKACLSFHSF